MNQQAPQQPPLFGIDGKQQMHPQMENPQQADGNQGQNQFYSAFTASPQKSQTGGLNESCSSNPQEATSNRQEGATTSTSAGATTTAEQQQKAKDEEQNSLYKKYRTATKKIKDIEKLKQRYGEKLELFTSTGGDVGLKKPP